MRFGVPIKKKKTERRENGKLISRTCDKSERNGREEGGKGRERRKKKIFRELRNLCETYTLYPRFCTCISCTVIVVCPSTLSSLFVIAFLIRLHAKYPGTGNRMYTWSGDVCIYITWLTGKLHERTCTKKTFTRSFTLISFTKILLACSF